jgi:hypothetical protein
MSESPINHRFVLGKNWIFQLSSWMIRELVSYLDLGGEHLAPRVGNDAPRSSVAVRSAVRDKAQFIGGGGAALVMFAPFSEGRLLSVLLSLRRHIAVIP